MATKRAPKKIPKITKKSTKGGSRTTSGSDVQKLKERVLELELLLEKALDNRDSIRCLKEDGEFMLCDNAVVRVSHYTENVVGIIIEDDISRKEAAELGEWLIQYSELGR